MELWKEKSNPTLINSKPKKEIIVNKDQSKYYICILVALGAKKLLVIKFESRKKILTRDLHRKCSLKPKMFEICMELL